jgi:hypothetical protein
VKVPRGHRYRDSERSCRGELRFPSKPEILSIRSTYATRLSAGGVADEWVLQLLRQGDSQVSKKYSGMKLQMQREALKLNRLANEMPDFPGDRTLDVEGFGTVLAL